MVNHPDVDAWEAWHPRRLAERLRDLPVPRYVAAGWSVDLFRGEQTRAHDDLEVAVPAAHFALLPPLFPELEFWVPAGDGVLVPLTAEALAGDSHQSWARDPAAGRWRFDVFREPHDGDVWICRRDEQRIRRRALIDRTRRPAERDRVPKPGTGGAAGRLDPPYQLADLHHRCGQQAGIRGVLTVRASRRR